MITAHEAVKIINEEMTYKPNWKLEAAIDPIDLWFGEGDRFDFNAIIATVNTSDPKLEQEIGIAPGGKVIIHPAWGREELVRHIFDLVMQIELHESREFFRVNGRAPFHPHRADGNDAFERTHAISINA